MRNKVFSFIAAGALFAALLVYSGPARDGAAAGLRLWRELLLPSLLPWFAAAGLLSRLGVTEAAGQLLSPSLGRLFRVSPAGCGVFLLGLAGGYPAGAAAAAEAVEAGRLDKKEAEHLLRFSDNTGPAFAAGALGAGIFRSAGTGLGLWAVHALTAVLLGICCRRGRAAPARSGPHAASWAHSFSRAFTDAVQSAVSAVLSIGGYVTFFSALLAVAGELGFPERAAELAAACTGADAAILRALFTGTLELSSGIGAMAGMAPTPAALALGSFLLGWGGLCVHLQSLAVTGKAGLDLKGRRRGKLLHGVLSAAVTYAAAWLFR
ncbi:MAG: hypothetical protein IJH47_07025 [Oscillospiraceae bacterium]|nr:hypothetical protein [Oscillospiraceae bacterium]